MKLIKFFLIIFLSIFLGLFQPQPLFAQQSNDQNSSLFDSLASGFAQLFTNNNPARLENPTATFASSQSPHFTLLIPQKGNQKIGESSINQWANKDENIVTILTREQDKKQLEVKITKIKEGEFRLSLVDQTITLGQYTLSVSARETFFYTRQLVLNFTWGKEKITNQTNEQKIGKGWLKSFLEENPEYKNLPIVKKDRNSIHFQKPDGSIEANFSAGPINYQDEKGNWQPIDTNLKEKDDEYAGDGTPVSIIKDGTVKIKSSTHSQKTNRFGWFDPESKTFHNLQDLPIGKIIDNQFIRETDAYKHVLTVLDNGLKEELILFSLPTLTPSDSSQPPYLVLETEVTGVNLPDGWIDESFTSSGQTFPLPTTKDAKGNEAPTKRFAKKIDGKQYIYTGIPYDWMTTAIYPVTIDPDFNGGTADGVTYGQNAVFATSRSTSVGNIDDANLYCGNQLNAGTYYTYRFHILFDTSTITARNQVTQVNLKMTPINKQTSTTWNVLIMKDDWSASNPIGAGNRETVFDNALGATQDDNIFHQADNMTNNTQYTSGNLSTSWVNKTGTTYYSIIGSNDLNSNVPTTNDYQHFASASHATSAYRPVLTVTYIPATINFENINLEGINID